MPRESRGFWKAMTTAPATVLRVVPSFVDRRGTRMEINWDKMNHQIINTSLDVTRGTVDPWPKCARSVRNFSQYAIKRFLLTNQTRFLSRSETRICIPRKKSGIVLATVQSPTEICFNRWERVAKLIVRIATSPIRSILLERPPPH